MKTAISLPDPVFAAADVLAARLRVSRSELYVMALEKFITENQESDITRRINAHIERHGQPADPVFVRTSVAEMKQVEW